MDSRDSGNLWTRRSNSNKLSLSTNDRDGKNEGSIRSLSSSKRFAGGESSSHGGRNPFNSITPISTSTVASPTSHASSAFALGTGAFASFGSANRTPKTPGTAFDLGKSTSNAPTPPPAEKKEKEKEKQGSKAGTSSRGIGASSLPSEETTSERSSSEAPSFPLKYTWVIWFRPPTSKNADYEKSIQAMARISTVSDFWTIYTHCKRPSALPTVSEYHFFKEGIRPIWEDEENRKGGKWTMRLKKRVADRYWENLLMALIGDQFYEAGEEVCGAVLSVRSGEDVFSIWTKNDGGRNVKIRETVKRVLDLPADTNIQWKSHDDSLAQRSAIDQARQERAGHHGTDKRRGTLSGDGAAALKDKSSGMP